MSSEGRHEIKAARKRLAAARAQASSAAKNVELAKATMQHAESMLRTSNEEVGAAEKGLKEAEKRWEVISIDIDDDVEAAAEGNGNSRKRKKVSLSPEAREGGSNDAQPSSSVGASGARQLFNAASSNNRGSSASATSGTNAGFAAASMPGNNNNSVARPGTNQGRAVSAASGTGGTGCDTMVVVGAGLPEVNGRYLRDLRPTNGGKPVWVKQGSGTNVGLEYFIYSHRGFWHIGSSPGNRIVNRMLYQTSTRIRAGSPVSSSLWVVGRDGVAPAPMVSRLVGGGGTASQVHSGSAPGTNATATQLTSTGANASLSNGNNVAQPSAGASGARQPFNAVPTNRGSGSASATGGANAGVAAASMPVSSVGGSAVGRATNHVSTASGEGGTGRDAIVVEGAGLPEVNGRYVLDSRVLCEGVPAWVKQGSGTNGGLAYFFYHCRGFWHIGTVGSGPGNTMVNTLYQTSTEIGAGYLVSDLRWVLGPQGVAPAPRVGRIIGGRGSSPGTNATATQRTSAGANASQSNGSNDSQPSVAASGARQPFNAAPTSTGSGSSSAPSGSNAGVAATSMPVNNVGGSAVGQASNQASAASMTVNAAPDNNGSGSAGVAAASMPVNNVGGSGVGQASNQASASSRAEDRIVVEGAGVPGVNGIYMKSCLYGGAPTYRKPRYNIVCSNPTKEWVIFRRGGFWIMGSLSRYHSGNFPVSSQFYKTSTRIDADSPVSAPLWVAMGRDGEAPAPKVMGGESVLPQQHIDGLCEAIKRLDKTWVEEEKRNGANGFYWNIMSSYTKDMVAKKVPMSVQELSGCDIPEDIQNKYGERLLSGVKEYLAQHNLMNYIERARDVRMVMSQASCSWATAAAALESNDGDKANAIMSLTT